MRERLNTVIGIYKEIEPLLSPIRAQLHDLKVDVDSDQLELRFRVTATEDRFGLMLRVVVLDEDKQIQVPNIFKPSSITQRGFGRSLIAAIRTAANRLGYRLFIVDLVPGFYRKLMSWGGRHVDDETVEITDFTRLSDVLPGESTFDELDKTYLSDECLAVGYERFVAEHPESVVHIERMGPDTAKILGIDYQKVRMKAIVQELEQAARAHGVDPFEYLLRYAVESEIEREEILLRRRQAIAVRLEQVSPPTDSPHGR
jgi:hypothetical protein